MTKGSLFIHIRFKQSVRLFFRLFFLERCFRMYFNLLLQDSNPSWLRSLSPLLICYWLIEKGGGTFAPPPFEIKIVYSNQKYSYDQNVFKNLIKIFAPPPLSLKWRCNPLLRPSPKSFFPPCGLIICLKLKLKSNT